MSTGSLEDWALHAYVDDEMSSEQRAEIEQLLLAEPELARKVEAWRRQRDLLKQAYDPTLAETVPESLVAPLRRGSGMRARPWLAMAAAVALLLIGGLAGWFIGREGAASSTVAGIARQAIDAHRIYAAEIRHPVEVRADEKGHLQTWLSKRVGTPFVVPDLSAEGYTLLGGRLLADGGTPSALLMYEDKAGQRISILLTARHGGGKSSLHVERQGELIACYWNDEALAFAVAGQLEREPMMRLAEAIYESFEG